MRTAEINEELREKRNEAADMLQALRAKAYELEGDPQANWSTFAALDHISNVLAGLCEEMNCTPKHLQG